MARLVQLKDALAHCTAKRPAQSIGKGFSLWNNWLQQKFLSCKLHRTDFLGPCHDVSLCAEIASLSRDPFRALRHRKHRPTSSKRSSPEFLSIHRGTAVKEVLTFLRAGSKATCKTRLRQRRRLGRCPRFSAQSRDEWAAICDAWRWATQREGRV
jgi:hypothetical protein